MFSDNNSINSLKDLLQALKDEANYQTYADVLKNVRFSYGEIEHLCFWDPENYTKITIEKNDKYELALICWEKGQQSAIHNHNNLEAWTYIVKGELTEELFENEASINSNVLGRRRMSTLLNHEQKKHRLSNSFDGRSVSLHLYKQ